MFRSSLSPDADVATPDGRQLVLAHMQWLLANMDYFCQQGGATLHTASLALHKDMLLLGLSTPDTNAGQLRLIERLRERHEIYERWMRDVAGAHYWVWYEDPERPDRFSDAVQSIRKIINEFNQLSPGSSIK